MSAKVILASAFLVFAVVMTIVGFVAFRKKNVGKYIGASAAVYASGCLLILIIALVRQNVPMMFFILAESLITLICGVSCAMLILVNTKILVADKNKKT